MRSCASARLIAKTIATFLLRTGSALTPYADLPFSLEVMPLEDRQNTAANFCEKGRNQHFLHHWYCPAVTPLLVLNQKRWEELVKRIIQDLNPEFSDSRARRHP